jgi:polyhydroxyalkanoate synthesis regulator phasin
MSNDELTKAILNVFKKELGIMGDVLPTELLTSIKKNITPELEKLIEKNGYVSKSKYESLEKLVEQLEKRIIDLEETL